MDIVERVEELARRTGTPIHRMVGRARAGELQGLFAFERLVEALLEVEVRRGECPSDQTDRRRHEIERTLTELAAEAGEPAAEKRVEEDGTPPR